MRSTSKKTRASGHLMQRIDKVAADLNVVLVVFAVGLATLDLTFLVTQKVVDRLPQVTRLAPPQADTPVDTSAPAQK